MQKVNVQWNGRTVWKHWDVGWRGNHDSAYEIKNKLFKMKNLPRMYFLNLYFEQEPKSDLILKHDQSCFSSARAKLLDCHY